MRKTLIDKNKGLICLIVLAAFVAGCSFLDPSDTKNQQTTEDNLAEAADGAAKPFVNGLELNFLQLVNTLPLVSDVMTDNYDNISTFLGGTVDFPIEHRDGTTRGYNNVHAIRALADFTIDVIVPGDKLATNRQKGLAFFYRGMSFMISAENWTKVPIAADTEPLNMTARLNLALADFDAALGFEPTLAARINIIKARTYRLLNDKTRALSSANAALAGASDFIYEAIYDPTSTTNAAYSFALNRNLHDIQPLPRLDFLDPKYLDLIQPMPVAKTEEAHLIIAEIRLSDGDFAGAKQALADAITLAQSRQTGQFLDIDPRDRTDLTLDKLPTTPGTLVKASPTAPALPNLFIRVRGEDNFVTIPLVSGSSLDPADVLAAPTATSADKIELLRILYLTRQEIFFLEGRRASDLGFRRSMTITEKEQNDTITDPEELDPVKGTTIYIPSYMPEGGSDVIDKFTVSGNLVTILFDMNQILADNRNAFIGPDASDVRTTLMWDFPF